MNKIKRIDRKVTRLLKALDRLDPKQEADQLGRSLRIGCNIAKHNIAKHKAKQRERDHDQIDKIEA